MSEVYGATDLVQGHRKVAVKVLKTGVIESSLLRESYDRETKALRALRHPGVVELIDDGFDDQLGAHFMVLEWMDSSLAELLKVRRPENWDHFYQSVGRPVLEALKFAHERRVSHRRPETVEYPHGPKCHNQTGRLRDFQTQIPGYARIYA